MSTQCCSLRWRKEVEVRVGVGMGMELEMEGQESQVPDGQTSLVLCRFQPTEHVLDQGVCPGPRSTRTRRMGHCSTDSPFWSCLRRWCGGLPENRLDEISGLCLRLGMRVRCVWSGLVWSGADWERERER